MPTKEEARLELARRELQKRSDTELAADANPPSFGYAQGTANAFGQGASFGFADELYGATQMLPEPYGLKGPDQSMGDAYRMGRDDYNQRQAPYKEENPGTAFAAELAGGIMAAGPTVKYGSKLGMQAAPQASNAFSRANAITKGAAAGTVGGAVYGAGSAEPGERLKGGAFGAGFGGVFGGVAPVVATALLKLGVTTWNGLKLAFNQQANPEKAAYDVLTAQLKRDGLTPDEILVEMRKLGDDAVPADVGGPNMLATADQIAQTPGKGKSDALEYLTKRQLNQGERLDQILFNNISGNQSTKQGLDDMMKQMKREAQPYYKTAMQIRNAQTSEIDDILLKLPKSVFKEAKELADLDGLIFKSPIHNNVSGVRKVHSAGYDLSTLHSIKMGIDDAMAKARRQEGSKTQSYSKLNDLRKALLKEMDAMSPDYAIGRRLYSNAHSDREAEEIGRKILNTDWDISEDLVKDMTVTEKAHYKMGVVRAIKDKFSAKVDKADKAGVFNKELIRDRVRSAFDDDVAFERFMRGIENEAKKSKTYTTAVGNSQTAARQAAKQDLETRPMAEGQNVIGMAVNAVTAPSHRLVEARNAYIANLLAGKDSQRLFSNYAQSSKGAFKEPDLAQRLAEDMMRDKSLSLLGYGAIPAGSESSRGLLWNK